MQYFSATCASEDAKFEAAIVVEASRHILPSLARTVADYGRDLTDREILIRVLESHESNWSGHIDLLCDWNDGPLKDIYISWEDLPESYEKMRYRIYMRSRMRLMAKNVYFNDLLPHGRAVAMLLGNDREDEVYRQFGKL